MDFSSTLRKRVNDYFKTNSLSKYGDWRMLIKSACMLLLFFGPLTIIDVGMVSGPLLLFTLYIISGLGMAGIGMGIMHDALHGSYSKNRKLNTIMGYTMNLIGANSAVWKVQHNVLHHTYTNIDEADDDLNAPFFLRFSPNAKRYWLHRYQHIYVWFFYGLSTLSWVTTKDFIRMVRYKRMGFFSTQGEFNKMIFKAIGWKILYYSYALILPLILVPLSPWIIVLAFICMHFVTGLSISLVFQTAHVMPVVVFPKPDQSGAISSSWAQHQLETTTNYAPKSRILSWLIGGLNFQVEHHLLPDICHVHYRKLSLIVAETAREYGIPYHSERTFFSAIRSHASMLRQLGRMEQVPA